ncbi:unannotated protein [freshwater metagenome]|uniref:Thiamine pyrimidine synthase n=1 Tax=freshwater metagenome TaxID=449393 RepID=A0A6J7I2Q0_9ZZZZ
MSAADVIRVQLQWVPQAQFAGEISAQAQGFYEAEGLSVTLVPGGADIDTVAEGSAPDGPEFTVSWLPKALAAVEAGDSDLVSIAQVFQRSGTRAISLKDSGITSVEQFRGKKVGVWDFGNEYEVTSGAAKYGLRAGVDYERVIQAFDMSALLAREIDVAEAMIYDGYAQILEQHNLATGRLYEPADLNVIDWNVEGSAMLQDAILARRSWLSIPGNEDVAVRFLRATFRGWMYVRDNPGAAINEVMASGTTQGRGHQTWQLNEINPLIWPSPANIGTTDSALWEQTIRVAIEGGVLKAAPPAGAFRNDLAARALDAIVGDTKGLGFVKGTAGFTAGGN